MSKPLILVDGSSYLHRAFHALPDLTTSKGEPTGAILGVLNMLRRLLYDYDPQYAVVVFDAKGKNFRHQLYPEYKANRAKMPDELRVQIEPLHEMVKLLGFPLMCIEGVEADDVIGTLSLQAASHGQEVIISTGDKDMAQLIHDHLHIIDTMKGVKIDRQYVMDKFGVPPELIVDFLSLVGDTSDNIPGIPSVGPKTAAKWLSQYGSLDQVMHHAHEITGKVGEQLRANIAQLPLAKRLATINTEVELDIPLEKMKLKPMDTEKLIPYLERFEFKSWLKVAAPVQETTPDSLAANTTDYPCILSSEDWQSWQAKLKQSRIICIDTETTSLDAMQAKLVGVSFSVKSGEAAYLPLAHTAMGCPALLPFDQTLAELKVILENPDILKVGQNLKYDVKVLAQHGINMQGIYFDTMLASYVLESGLNRHDMDTMAKKHLGIKTTSFEEVAGKGAKQIGFNEVGLEQATAYAAEDADITFRLYEYFAPKLQSDPNLNNVFQHEEMPMLSVLAEMERNGVLLDIPLLKQHSHELSEKIKTLEEEAHKEAGQAFNLSSPKQLLQILFEKMQLPVLKKTPTGQASTAEEVLEELAITYPLPRIILEHRHLSKLKSTYTDKLPLLVHPETGRVHTSYHQAVAITGRLSSTDPNLQNIPIKSEEGRRIRQAFIASPGYKILAADYSQIELRIMAHLSQDEGLLKAFANNEDVHRATASEVFAVPMNQVNAEQRRRAKAINFGLIYGMSAFGLAKQLGISREEAALYVKVYFERYPGVARYMEHTRLFAKENGFVETLFGRRLYLPEINAKNGMNRKGAERAAINAPMQGTAADIIKRAMISLQSFLKQSDIKASMLMQVHDELVFEVAEADVERLKKEVIQHMESAALLNVPLIVDVGVGENWDKAH
ncbi:MAG: polymerase [Gammaproteobacteria bacterium]|jgi:DNA polymerase-1|nr:polymerase [Gammaproteobacteria bacterium]